MKTKENELPNIAEGVGSYDFTQLFLSEEPTTEEAENEDITFNVEGDNNEEEEEQEQEEQVTDPEKDKDTPSTPTKEKDDTEKTVELENTQPSVYAGLAKNI